MGGVDQSDMMLYAYLNERRTVKYWKKVAFSILNRMFVNSYILYKQNTAAENPIDRYKFYVQAVEQLVEDYLGGGEALPERRQKPGVVMIPDGKEKDCCVCSDRKQPGGRKRSRTACTKCHKGLHGTCLAKHL
ncbi:PiggyBac transposable element-derived protein 4 [Elysia marginata]|uniref:PiggyBac transposable element-derived protein 4 n=1 Tax=Elysia marginata TaxID=1093978 RepID=A0AAV4EDV0_9GAST|nr:PiggyBac transposable element-derived protein 4 [Elysia marginata]